MTKNTYAHWQGRPIADAEDVHALEQRSAIHEFNDKMPRAEAEDHAYSDYVKDRRLDAAAHHLAGMKAAHGVGDMDEARKHGVMYELHVKALGLNPHGPVPHEVSARLSSMEQGGIYRFKPHKGDIYALNDRDEADAKKSEFVERGRQLLKKVSEDLPVLVKAEPQTETEGGYEHRKCEYMAKTTGELCKNPRSRKVGARYLCHWHADLAAKDDHKADKSKGSD